MINHWMQMIVNLNVCVPIKMPNKINVTIVQCESFTIMLVEVSLKGRQLK